MNCPVPSIIWGQVGAGIVADSDPLSANGRNRLQKAQAQLLALGLTDLD
jgi:anthranilate/para-aminobenzoate synthase component I